MEPAHACVLGVACLGAGALALLAHRHLGERGRKRLGRLLVALAASFTGAHVFAGLWHLSHRAEPFGRGVLVAFLGWALVLAAVVAPLLEIAAWVGRPRPSAGGPAGT